MSGALPQPAAPRVEVEHLYTDLLIHKHKELHIYTHIVDCLALGLQLADFFQTCESHRAFETLIIIQIIKSLLHSVGGNLKSTAPTLCQAAFLTSLVTCGFNQVKSGNNKKSTRW